MLDHVLEDDDAELIRGVVPAVRVHLLVQADHVHAVHLQHRHVKRQRLVARGQVLVTNMTIKMELKWN